MQKFDNFESELDKNLFLPKFLHFLWVFKSKTLKIHKINKFELKTHKMQKFDNFESELDKNLFLPKFLHFMSF